ncbi:MAG: hypothetical protein QM726_01000 [Chitinophagaceae bacterium]
MRNNAPEKDGGSESVILHAASGNDRKISFVHLNGSCLSLNYNFFIWHEYHADQSTLLLGFSSHLITLSGLRMDKLFEAFDQQLPQRIICKDVRYNSLVEGDKPIVNEIQVTSKS